MNTESHRRSSSSLGAGFHSFVALRYLMAAPPRRVAAPLLGFMAICVFGLAYSAAYRAWVPLAPPFAFGIPDMPVIFFHSAAWLAALAPTAMALAVAVPLSRTGSLRAVRSSLWIAILAGLSATLVACSYGAVRQAPDSWLARHATDLATALAAVHLLVVFGALLRLTAQSRAKGQAIRDLVVGAVLLAIGLVGTGAISNPGPLSVLLPYQGFAYAVVWGGGFAVLRGVLRLVDFGAPSFLERAAGSVLWILATSALGVALVESMPYLWETATATDAGMRGTPAAIALAILGLLVLITGLVVIAVRTVSGRTAKVPAAVVMDSADEPFSRRERTGSLASVWPLVVQVGLALMVFAALTTAFGLVESIGQPTLSLLGIAPGEEYRPLWLVAIERSAIILGSLALCLCVIRYVFSFFTTVSIGGVLVGTMALIMVLSVMGGFENDLRQKILGSNAHILVTKPEGDFADYREVGAKLGEVEGVVAYSPYLMSEVVIAARQNYANVIIKGIDPTRVGKVTQLEDDIQQKVPRPLGRLYPLAPDGGVLGAPPDAAAIDRPVVTADSGPTLDPAPDDLEVPDFDPVDLSGGSVTMDGGVPPARDVGLRSPDELDPLPDDLDIPDADPMDLSGGLTETPPFEDEDDPVDDSMGEALGGSSDAGPRDTFVDADELGLGDMPPLGVSPEVAVLPGVLVGSELVKTLSNYVGQEVTVVSPLGQDTPLGPVPRTKRYRVAGTFYTGMYEYDLKYVYVELGTLQDFLDIGDQVNGIEIRVVDPNRTDRIMADLAEVLGPAYRVQDWRELNKSLFSALKLEKIAMFIVLAIIILVASFSIVGNLVMIVIEKAREIAVLKTLGATDRAINRVFIGQGFVIGVVGMVTGVSLGLVHTLVTLRGFPLDANVYYIDRLPIALDPISVVYVALAGLVISTLATLYPARLAASQRPVEGLSRE